MRRGPRVGCWDGCVGCSFGCLLFVLGVAAMVTALITIF